MVYDNDEVADLFRPKESLSPREIYLLRAIGLVDQVCLDFTHLPAARAHRVHAAHLSRGGFDTQPEVLQNLKREVAKFYLQIAGAAKDAGQPTTRP